MHKTIVVEIFKFVFLGVYYDAFDDVAYKKYLEFEYEKYIANLPDRIRVVEALNRI